LIRGGLLRRVLATEGDWGATVARVALGGVMLPHGVQKLLGWFGGYGFQATMGFLTTQVGLVMVGAPSRPPTWRTASS
jgi:putative oxidoreductase